MTQAQFNFTGYDGKPVLKTFDVTDEQALFLAQFTDALKDVCEADGIGGILPDSTSKAVRVRVAAVVAMDAFQFDSRSLLALVKNLRDYMHE